MDPMNEHDRPADPVTLEIISNALRSITDETFVALMRSAYSTNVEERRDHSTAIMDARGWLDHFTGVVTRETEILDTLPHPHEAPPPVSSRP